MVKASGTSISEVIVLIPRYREEPSTFCIRYLLQAIKINKKISNHWKILYSLWEVLEKRSPQMNIANYHMVSGNPLF